MSNEKCMMKSEPAHKIKNKSNSCKNLNKHMIV